MSLDQTYHSSIYIWGSNAHGALGCLGDKSSTKVQLIPRRLPSCCQQRYSVDETLSNGSISNAVDVAAGHGISTVITDRWEAFSWGNSTYTEDGKRRANAIPSSRKNGILCQSIRKLLLDNVAFITHGQNHSVSISTKGDVFGWGKLETISSSTSKYSSASNRSKRSIHSVSNTTKKIVEAPIKISIEVEGTSKTRCLQESLCKSAACGERHTCILKDDGTLITLGANDAGQLGIQSDSEGNNGIYVIHRVQRYHNTLDNIRFKEISCGNNHSAAISVQDGSIYTWGWGKNGRLGHGNESMCQQPCFVETLVGMEPFSTVACGSAHTLVVSEEGNVYGFGWNSHGQVLGASASKMLDTDTKNTPSLSDCLLPITCLENKGILKISCGFAHSAAVSLNGELYCWGMNDDGQCGLGHEMPVLSPTQLCFEEQRLDRYVISVSCGHSHTVCILSNFSPLQSFEWFRVRQKYPVAASVINRFARSIIFRLRFFKHHKLVRETLLREPIIEESAVEKTELKSSEDEACDFSSTSSSENSWSEDSCIVEDSNIEKINTNEVSQRLIEMQKMLEEDYRSKAPRDWLQSKQERSLNEEKLVLEKIRAQTERDQMQKEDIFSTKVRSETNHQIYFHQVRPTTNVRKAFVDDQIKKVAERLKEARIRKEMRSKVKVLLPPVSRERYKMQQLNRPILSPVDNMESTKARDSSQLRMRQKLLKRREIRLRNKHFLEKEAILAMQQRLEAERETALRNKRIQEKQLEEDQQRTMNALKLRRLRRSTELQELENSLRLTETSEILSKAVEDKYILHKFWDVSQWTKTLSGMPKH